MMSDGMELVLTKSTLKHNNVDVWWKISERLTYEKYWHKDYRWTR